MTHDFTPFSSVPAGSIAERFDRAARQHAEDQAISTDHGCVTYAQLAVLVARVAHRLLEGGVQSGDRIALFFDRSPGAYAALLGVLKTGAVVVPLVPNHPIDRLRQILDDARPGAIVSNGRPGVDTRALADSRIPVIEAEDLPAAPAREWPALEESSPAVLLYTSGSTGKPKGVLHTHKSVLGRINRTAHLYALTSRDRVAMFSTYAVGQGLSAMLIPLLSGATLCPFDVRREGLSRLADWLDRESITIYLSAATLFRTLTRSLEGSRRFANLRLVRISGERVTAADVASHWRLFPEAQLLITYSTTECGTLTAGLVTARDQRFTQEIVPVGRPLEGMQILVMDENGREVPCGETGEIVVRSAYLSPGYWGDAERTAATFLPVPGSSDEREYRTGDLGRMRPDGLLEHLGRKDFRVKIRGFRVEIEEIEMLLENDPDVLRAAVSAKADRDGDVRLVAYVQPRLNARPTIEALRARLGSRLPEHAIPSAIVIMEILPTTDAGKTDRTQLPDPSSERPALAATCVTPRTDLETAIAAIWGQVLGLENIGVHDAFLSIGGDSLKATRVASQLTSTFGVDLPLWELFEASTIADVALVVERYTRADDQERRGES